MPKVLPLNQGYNAPMIAGLSERARSMQAQRNTLSLSAVAGPITLPLANSYTAIPGGPSITINIGPSGCAFVLWSFQPGTNCPNVVFGIDGVVNSLSEDNFGQSEFYSFFGTDPTFFSYFGLTGLTPGWTTFNLWTVANVPGQPVTVNQMTLQAWPL